MRENDGLYVVERTMVCIKRPRCDTNEGCETEVTVTSELHAQAERTKLRERAQGHSLYYREERRVASEERDVGFY